ncbi:hypothetical protein [Limnoraphis robusta]|uniref:Uncharacterized protein n=1 Tax=Limnoraphis robusta CCNP1315 TaxID=3110306 RepID=A0ABU5U6N6_9CYAN|nr:hypothetical protein [Limnoraphis robusta]MEA5522875.1 hypothetical protein [Limnoraphis robusta CCNP1315]MEA5546863.1 hypothetical protein [Limnoraphis robusta CCNP1324]
MKLGNFSLRIPEGKELKTQHVILSHGQQYTIEIANSSNLKCDASIYLDGDFVGNYRLDPGQVWAVEHPPDSQGRFTFYRSGSEDAKIVGEDAVENQNKGLVQVTFFPEKQVLRAKGIRRLRAFASGDETRDFSGGVSGLSGHSFAQYSTAESIDKDENNAVTINLRLVIQSDNDSDTPQPLSSRKSRMSNPIPPAV